MGPLIAIILNESFATFTVPDCWKIGFVTPLLKKVTCSSLDDVRAITQTDVFSKIAESFMFDRIYSQIIDKINVNQFGALKKSSTAHYLIQINHFILKSIEIPGATVLIAAIDSLKAFDLVDHSLLAALLVDLGVHDIDILWLLSFLKFRKQIVKFEKSFSNPKRLTCGTPAGTKLAALLFIILINPILNALKIKLLDINPNFCIAGYIDDLVIAERVIGNAPKLQSALNILSEECKAVKITPNPRKCEILVVNFGGRRVNFPTKSFCIDSVPIPVVKSLKILGVTFCPNFSWDSHIKNIVAKANSKLFQLRKLFNAGFSSKELLIAYGAYIRCNLEYCSVVFGSGLNQKLVYKIESVQKKALSIIFRKRVDHLNYVECMQEAELITLNERRELALNKFAYKLFFGRYRHFLPQFQRASCSGVSLRSNKDLLFQPVIKSSKFKNSPINMIISKINDEWKSKSTVFGLSFEALTNLIDYS